MADGRNLILCVDDEVVGLRVRKVVLERAGYLVLTAQNGQDGLELFHQNPVNAVVLDYSMPGMQGDELAARMRQSKPEVPIVLLSAYVILPTKVTDLVNLHLTKGAGVQMLLSSLYALLAAEPPPERADTPSRGQLEH